MGLADPGRPQQQQRFAMRHPATGGELADLSRIERGLGGKPLDKRGLDALLIFDARRLKLDGTGQVLLGEPRRPLIVAQRLTLEHQLARVEFLARIGLRVSP